MSAAAGGAAAAAAIAQAIRASGVLVKVESSEFQRILDHVKEPLVVTAEGGFLSTTYTYLTSYKGLAFHTKTATPLRLPAHCEIVVAQKIWIP